MTARGQAVSRQNVELVVGLGSTQEVKEAPAGAWTVRDGRIARAEFYTDRAEARQAMGLEG
jgi:hypothetical protein